MSAVNSNPLVVTRRADGMTRTRHFRRRRRALALAGAALALAGCATYSEQTSAAREFVTLRDYESALDRLNDALGVDEADELPKRWSGDRPLAVLERAVLLQAMERWEESAASFGAADRELDLLDLGSDPVGALGRYVYSDSATRYRSSPTEKLALNSLNLLNYLMRGDLAGAAVEARRFSVMREYLENSAPGTPHGAFGSYLAGFVFEKQGDPGRALRYYDEALAEQPLDSLREPVMRLAKQTPVHGARVSALLESEASRGYAGRDGDMGEILVALALGRVPHKVPKRIPVGAAIGLAGTYVTGDLDFLKYGALKVISYPELAGPPFSFQSAEVRIDGELARCEVASNLDSEIRREYEALKPQIIAAAISRLAARAATAEGLRQAGRQAKGDAGDVVGALAALAAEGALLALDKPDTRSWTLLPAQLLVARLPVAPGRHEVELRLSGAIAGAGETRRFSVEVPPGGFAPVAWTVPR
jgi:tetratricopeptide (TPR) repeat protein